MMCQTLPRPQPHCLTLGFEEDRFHRHTVTVSVLVQGQPLPGRTAIKEYPLWRKPSSRLQRNGLPWGPHQETRTGMGAVSACRVRAQPPNSQDLGVCPGWARLSLGQLLCTVPPRSKMLIPAHSCGTSRWISTHVGPSRNHSSTLQIQTKTEKLPPFPLPQAPESPSVSTAFTS